jgi:hypothetical protein
MAALKPRRDELLTSWFNRCSGSRLRRCSPWSVLLRRAFREGLEIAVGELVERHRGDEERRIALAEQPRALGERGLAGAV